MLSKIKKFLRGFIKVLLLVLGSLIVLAHILPFLVPVEGNSVALLHEPYENSEHFVTDGVDLHYRVWEAADPVGKVLLIHGFGGSTANWQGNVDALVEAGYSTVAVDLPGFGYSSRMADLDHSQSSRSRWLWALLDNLDANRWTTEMPIETWTLVGHSMGAGTALAMADSQPERANRLVLVDGALYDNVPKVASLMLRYPPMDRWVQLAFNYYLRSPAPLQSALTGANGQIPTAEQMQSYAQPFQIQGTARALTDQIRTAQSIPAENLANLPFPVAAIWGDRDTWVPTAVLDQYLTIRPKISVEVVAGAGHLPMESHPDLFNQALLKLLSQ